MNSEFDEVGYMMAWEYGTLSDDKTVELFQYLIDNGSVWDLQGCYGRAAMHLIEAGYCHPAPAPERA